MGIFFLKKITDRIGRQYPLLSLFWIFFLWTLCFSLGIVRIFFTPQVAPENDVGNFAVDRENSQRVEMKGFISAFPDRRFDKEYWTFTAESVRVLSEEHTEKHSVEGNVLLRVSPGNSLQYGDELTVQGRLQIPFESEEFSYRKYLAREQIFSVMYFPYIESSGEERNHLFLTPLFALRTLFDEELKKHIPAPESAFAAGILIGDRSGFTPAQDEQFRITGLTHLLALSGSNITIIVLAVFWVFAWLPKNIRLFLTLFFLVLFVFFVGGGASIIRAAIMGAIGLFVVHSGRRAEGFTLLLFASSIMVLWKPLILVYDPSFQLSVGGVIGMLFFCKRFEEFFRNLFRMKTRFWAEILSATLAAQIGVLPLIGYLFGEISLISPLANLLIIPLIPAGMLFSFLSVSFGFLSNFLGDIFGFIAWNILHFGYFVIDILASIPGASISFSLGNIGFFVGSAIVLLWGVWLQMRERGKQILRN